MISRVCGSLKYKALGEERIRISEGLDGWIYKRFCVILTLFGLCKHSMVLTSPLPYLHSETNNHLYVPTQYTPYTLVTRVTVLYRCLPLIIISTRESNLN
jgi:hypothetical protein